DPLAELTGRELLAVLEEEVGRLPAAYRLAVTLCCLEGLSQEEAARRLNATVGALRGRLERGRARLYARLAGRGMVPAAVLAVAGLGTPEAATAALPPGPRASEGRPGAPPGAPDGPGKGLVALERKLVGEWKGEGSCLGDLTLRADGTFERRRYSPGNNTLAG